MTQNPADRLPFLLRMWGGGLPGLIERFNFVVNDDETVVAVWFATKADRDAFIATDRNRPRQHPFDTLVFDTSDVGDKDSDGVAIDIHRQAIAAMTMRLPDGRAFAYRYVFGYGYPLSSAWFMFHEGNYSCDCNRRSFLRGEYPEAFPDEDDPCGDTITLEDFTVYKEVTPTDTTTGH